MPQVSKSPLSKEVNKKIIDGLWWLIAALNNQSDVDKFLGDLLTKTEKTMLAKRLAIALMLEKGRSYWEIRDVLKVSTSTILGIRHWLDQGGEGYRLAIRKLLKKEKSDRFWEEIGKATVELLTANKLVNNPRRF